MVGCEILRDSLSKKKKSWCLFPKCCFSLVGLGGYRFPVGVCKGVTCRDLHSPPLRIVSPFYEGASFTGCNFTLFSLSFLGLVISSRSPSFSLSLILHSSHLFFFIEAVLLLDCFPLFVHLYQLFWQVNLLLKLFIK